MHQNGIVLPTQPVVQPIMNVAQPMNDTQMVSLMAAQCPGDTPQDKVEYALQIVCEAMRQVNSPEFAQRCKAIAEDLKKAHE